jgi:hypothetical protein
MSFLNKRVEDSIKQAKLLAQMSEMSYRSLNGTRQTRSSFTNNDLKEQSLTDKPAVGSLTSEMIAQYKREEEEQNRYVDPSTGAELRYGPTGMTPVLSTSTLKDVASLTRPATVVDVSTEKNKYAKIYQDIQDKKQEIEDKKREGKEKEKEKAEKEAEVKELKREWAEIDTLKKTFEKEEKKAMKRLALLSGISTPKKSAKDKDEQSELIKLIPEIQARIVEFVKKQTDLESIYLPMETTEIPNLVTVIKTLLTEIKTIQTVDIPPLETALEQSEKDIKTYQENVEENDIIENETGRKNKKIMKEYQDTFNIMNKNRYQVTQDPTETDAAFIKRIDSLEKMPFDKNIFKDRAATEGNKKFMKKLKDITRDEVKISEIVKSFTSPEEVFLINNNWSYILNRLKSVFGVNNPAISANDYNIQINEQLNEIQSGKTPITVVAPTPGTSSTTTSASATAPTGVALTNLDHSDGTPSDFEIGIDNNSLFIQNKAESKAIYIKIANKNGLIHILFSNSTSDEGNFRAFKFGNVNVNDSFHFKKMLSTLKLDEKLNKDIKIALFGTNRVKEDIYAFLQSTYKLTSETAKPFVESGKVIMGYGLKTESIPDICHFGKNIILLKKLYYNNILSVKNKKMHAIEYFTNVKVSDNFVDVILQMCKNSKPNINNLTPDEKQLLDTLLHVCGIKSSANSSKKDDVVNELKNKFKLAEGQLRAGNNNPLVIKELKDILKKLTLYNVVTLKNSKDYLKQF